MIILDKTNKIVEKSDCVHLGYLVSRISDDLATQYSENVSIVSLEDLLNLHKEDVITDEEMAKAKKDYIKMIGKEKIKNIKCFVFTDTENKREITIQTPLQVERYATEQANDIINIINSFAVNLDIVILENVEELINYSRDCSDDIFDEIKNFLLKKINYTPPSQTELANFLGVTKGAVSQYDKIKKRLMLQGLWVEKNFN